MKNVIKNDVVWLDPYLDKAISYKEYRDEVAAHVAKGTSSAPGQNDSLSHYTLLNNSRMKRLDKTVKIPEIVQEKFKNFQGKQTWLVVTESWCGDAANSIPIMNSLTSLTENVSLKLIYRDEHPEVIDAFLTNKAKAIPKLIVIDHNLQNIKTTWGPRPSFATEKVKAFKEAYGTLTAEFKKDLQIWYNKDKGQNIIEDLTKLID